jgi:hypothetical protein
MYPVVTQIKISEDYVLQISFDNGERGELDMSPYLDFGVFSRLKNKAEFQKAKVSFDTIEWPYGVDLDPEFVYQKTVKES